MTQIRPHVPDYAQSMARAVYINNADDVFAYLRCFMPEKIPQLAEIAQRHFGRDYRNNWDSWLITLHATPVLWADGPVPGIRQLESISEFGQGSRARSCEPLTHLRS